MTFKNALIVGAGSGLSASLAKLMLKDGMQVALAARSTAKLEEFAGLTGARTIECDAAQAYDIEKLFDDLDAANLTPDVVVYNPRYRVRGALVDLDLAEVEIHLAITAFGGFLVAQQAVRRMLPQNRQGRGEGA